jgi:hypothetical protein
MMRHIVAIGKPLRTSICFCGSGLKYRHCHRKAFETCAEIGVEVVLNHAGLLDQAMRKQSAM